MATRLRPRVLKMLVLPTAAVGGLWLLACLGGAGLMALGWVLGIPAFAVFGPLLAICGGVVALGCWLAILLREVVWVGALGIPKDWRGPWMTGELAEVLGWARRSVPVTIPSGKVSRKTGNTGPTNPTVSEDRPHERSDTQRAIWEEADPVAQAERQPPAGPSDTLRAVWGDADLVGVIEAASVLVPRPGLSPVLRPRMVDAARVPTPKLANGAN